MAKRSTAQTVLVTGGAGFIGSNFIRHWMKQYPQDQVINLDALTYAGNVGTVAEVSELANYSFVEGNICDPGLVNRIMADVDVVVHFAAESHVDRSILDPSLFVRTNVLGTQVLLEAALKQKIKRFHHISTDEVFGSLALDSQAKFTEQTPYDPRSPYSASKAGSDHLVRAYGETYGLNYTLTNCSNNYGEFQFPEKFIPLAITNIMDGQPVPMYGDGLNVRDWLYVQDHCRAIELVIEEGQPHHTYVVGGLLGDTSNLEVAQLLIKLLDADPDLIQFVKDRAGHDRRYAVDWRHINQELGWEPSVDLEAGLQATIKWYQANQDWWRPLKASAQDFFAQNYQSKT